MTYVFSLFCGDSSTNPNTYKICKALLYRPETLTKTQLSRSRGWQNFVLGAYMTKRGIMGSGPRFKYARIKPSTKTSKKNTIKYFNLPCLRYISKEVSWRDWNQCALVSGYVSTGVLLWYMRLCILVRRYGSKRLQALQLTASRSNGV